MSRRYSPAWIVGSVVLCSGVALCANAQSLSSALGATKLDGLTNLTDCTNQSQGYRERIIGERLAAKLAISSALSAEERAVWQADVDALKAVKPGSPFVPPNAKEPQHYLLGLKDELRVRREGEGLLGPPVELFIHPRRVRPCALSAPRGAAPR